MERAQLKKMIRESTLRKLEEQEMLEEQLAQKISDAVGKLVNYWKQKKAQAGKSEYVLDQASSALKRSIMSTFADINKRLERGKFADVEKQKTGGTLDDFIREAFEEELQEEEDKNNPWAICTASVGRKDKEKYERCVQDVKKGKN